MINLNYMHNIGIAQYLYESEMITKFEHKGNGFAIDFERDAKTEESLQKEDRRLHNKIKQTRIYIKISEELRRMEDITKDYRNTNAEKHRIDDPRSYLEIDFDGYKQKHKSERQKLRGNKISTLTKDMKEEENKQKIQRSIEVALRKLHTQKRISTETYKQYLIYMLENFDIMNAQEMKEELKMIRQEFKPSGLAKSWERVEQKKCDGSHISKRKGK